MLHQGQETIPSIIQDHREWHRGRKDYSLWLIDAATEEICEKVEAAKEHLSDYLLKPYQRQPHITIFVCGFLTDTPHFDDDYSTEQFRVQTQMLEEGNIKSFFIEIGGLNSFSSAPFLEVHDLEGGIERARVALSTSVSEIGRSTFTPHITIGLYSGAYPSKIVAGKISTFESRTVRLKVERIMFGTYHAQKIAGALTHQCYVPLRKW
jgi:2'-5' RNA ligase